MSPNIFDEKHYLRALRVGDDQLVEDVIKRRIQIWRENRHDMPSYDRIFTYCGNPGIGKSWLLGHLAHEFEVDILDMDFANQCQTPGVFVAKMQSKIDLRKGLILIDHVPNITFGNSYHEQLKSDILIPALNKGCFFVMAQQDSKSSCWGGAFPNPGVYTVKGFQLSQRNSLFHALFREKFPENTQGSTLFNEEIYPLLMQIWQDERRKNNPVLSEEQIVMRSAESFLKYWLKKVGKNSPVSLLEDEDAFLLLAGSLTRLDNLMDIQGYEKILKVICKVKQEIMEISNKEIRSLLGTLDWILAYDHWQEPIRTILGTWFSIKEPVLAKELQN